MLRICSGNPNMKHLETLGTRVLLDHSKFLRVEEHIVRFPDGTVIPDWPWLVTPEYVSVVAITRDKLYICFRQMKYAVDGISLAPVGGFIEADEDPLTAAKRELLEETGHTASHWESLGHYIVDANRGAGRAHFFLAQDTEQTSEPCPDDLEEMQLVFLSRQEIIQGLRAGDVKVLPWIAIFSRALI